MNLLLRISPLTSTAYNDVDLCTFYRKIKLVDSGGHRELVDSGGHREFKIKRRLSL